MVATDLRVDSGGRGPERAGRRGRCAYALRNRTSEAKRNILAHNFRRFEFLERPSGAGRRFFAAHSALAGGLLFPIASNFWGRGGPGFSNRQSRKADANPCRARDVSISGKGSRRCANLELLSCAPWRSLRRGPSGHYFSILAIGRTRAGGSGLQVR